MAFIIMHVETARILLRLVKDSKQLDLEGKPIAITYKTLQDLRMRAGW
jgi:hypothetical protein